MEPLDLLHINLSRLVRYQWRLIRREQCRVSRLGKTVRAHPEGRARTRIVRARAKERKARGARIRNHRSRLSSFKGYGGYCEKWRHKRADCRKRIADGKWKGGAAAASADNDGDVAAVMDVDDFVMDAEKDEASTDWCFWCFEPVCSPGINWDTPLR